MLHTKFCSQCGEKIKGKRRSLFGFMAFCAPCKKQMRFARIALVAVFISFIVGIFFAGRATIPHQSFQPVGTPIELQSAGIPAPPKTGISPANSKTANTEKANTEKRAASSETTYPQPPEEPLTICGAPTASGRPCHRKVRGGGYCWQHKDKFKAQAKASQ